MTCTFRVKVEGEPEVSDYTHFISGTNLGMKCKENGGLRWAFTKPTGAVSMLPMLCTHISGQGLQQSSKQGVCQ